MPKHLRRCRTHSLNLNCYAAALRSANDCQQLHIPPLWICTKTLEAFSSRNRIVPSIDGCWMWRHISKKDYSITLFPKMSEVFEFCCQKSAKFVAKSLWTLLPKGSAEYSSYPLSLWLQSSLNEMKRLVTASLPSRLHHIQSHSVPSRLHLRSHPGHCVSPIQALSWSSFWNGAGRAHGPWPSSPCLALPRPSG